MELTIRLPEDESRLSVTGPAERHFKLLRESLGVNVVARNGAVRLSGDSDVVGQAARVIEQLTEAAGRDEPMTRPQLIQAIAQATAQPRDQRLGSAVTEHAQPLAQGMPVYLQGKRVLAKSHAQHAYIDAIDRHDLTLCVGPAGTGKTYLAVAAAVSLLKRGQVRKLVLVRPAVEAGEKLGFLPGSMQEKVNPYLRPLLDALHDMMPFDQIERFMAADLIEIVPLAFMRGRTLNDALIILDEAQNTTRSQMLMFLTRLGQGGKMVVTGDTSQIDLDDPRDSGLVDAAHRLRRTRGVAMVTLHDSDIVRHHLVQRIVQAYGQDKPAPPQLTETKNKDEGEGEDQGAQTAP